MRPYHLAALLVLCAPLPAQTALFVGRFDMVSLDAANERPGGSITELSGFDISYVEIGSDAVARVLTPTTAHAAMMGDPIGDGDYTRFASYFPNDWDFASPFVRDADRSLESPPVFFTVRDNRVTLQFDVFTQSGVQTIPIRAGDYFRWAHNGNIELFITQDLLKKADGLHPTGLPETHGASALVQDSQGNLYYSPEEGGTWVIGNDPANPFFCSRAGIIMIDAQDITYDAAGNVQDVVADSAHVIFGGSGQGGPNGQPSVLDFAFNAGANDYSGIPIASFYNTSGLGLDPAGGTLMSSIPRVIGGNTVYDTVPNFVFTSDSGTQAGTMFSTQNGGSIAVINGVQFGSNVAGVPASGAWWGVQQNTAAFSPTLMGFAFIDPFIVEPFAADAPNDGAVLVTDPTMDVDFYPGASSATFMLLAAGPAGPGLFQFSADVSALLGPFGFSHLYTLFPPTITVPLGVSNPAGYITFSIANPHAPSLLGLTLMAQGIRLPGGGLELSTPVPLQFK